MTVSHESSIIVLTNTSRFSKLSPATGSFPETGFDVRELAYATFATPNGGEAPMDPRSKKDSESDSVVKEFLNDNEPLRMLKNTVKLDQVDSSKVKLVILIGGHGALFDFPKSTPLSQLLSRVYFKNQGIIAAISQGVIGLINLKDESDSPYLKGKRITCSADEEERRFREELPFTVQDKLQEMGAKVETQQAFQPNVLVTEERLITAQNSQSSMRFAQIIKETWEKFHREE